MKKLIAMMLAVLMLTFAGCTFSDTEKDTNTSSAPVTEDTTFMEESTSSADTDEETATEIEETSSTEQDTTESTEEESTTEGATTNQGSSPVLYQISPGVDTLLNCYIIKTRHDKYIIIDGGGAGYSGSSATDGFLAHTLRDITGQTTIEIEAWFLSHLHNDHVTEFVRLSQNQRLNVTVNNMYLNAPSAAFMERVEEGGSAFLHGDVKAAYDHFRGEGEFDRVNGKTVFEGDVIEIDGVTIEILMTMSEDETEGNINDTSLIFRVTTEGQTILFLNDAFVPEGNRLLAKYGDALQSDIVQMAHHGQNGVSQEVYQAINPTMCLWPSPAWVFDNPMGMYKTDEVRGWMADLGVKYHLIACKELNGSLTFPVNFDDLEEFPIRKNAE